MKQIFSLLLLFTLLACSKDDKDAFSDPQKHNKEVQKNILGKWRFHSLRQGNNRYDAVECDKKSTIEFTADWRYIYTDSCAGKGYESRYYTGINEEIKNSWVETDSSIVIWPDYLFVMAPGSLGIERYSQDELTLSYRVSSSICEDCCFTTYKRVK